MIDGKGPEFDRRAAAHQTLWNAIDEYATLGPSRNSVMEELDLALKIFTKAVERCAISSFLTSYEERR